MKIDKILFITILDIIFEDQIEFCPNCYCLDIKNSVEVIFGQQALFPTVKCSQCNMEWYSRLKKKDNILKGIS